MSFLQRFAKFPNYYTAHIHETSIACKHVILEFFEIRLFTVPRKDRLKTCFSFHIDKKGCVKVDKEGQGLATVWRQQLQQFKNVSADMANAIVAEYPSPWLLYQVCGCFASRYVVSILYAYFPRDAIMFMQHLMSMELCLGLLTDFRGLNYISARVTTTTL